MNLFPNKRWTISSPLDVPTLVAGMRQRIEPDKLFRWGRAHTPLQGSVGKTRFTVRRVIHYQNSFLPVIEGRFEPTPHGTDIHIHMAMHPFVAAFLALWLGGVGMFGLAIAVCALDDGRWEGVIVPGSMFLFGLLLAWGCYRAEDGKSRQLFDEVLQQVHQQAELAPPAPHALRRLKRTDDQA